MSNSQKKQQWFWNRYASLYDFEINQFSKRAYTEIYRLITARLNPSMDVLEIATGTGLIALNIASAVRSVTAIDFSPKMIATAMKKKVPQNVCFRVGDATALTYEPASFDAVIISNALHVMPEPAKALAEISRVLKPNGILIAPNFTHGHIKEKPNSLNAQILKLIGFETYSKWLPQEYVAFVSDNGFAVENWQVLKAAFPLVYLEAQKR